MNEPTILQVEWIFADTGIAILGYCLGPDGLPVRPADIATVTLKVVERQGTVSLAATSLDPADVLFDPPVQGDPRWSGPPAGYNFLAVVPHTAFPQPDSEYRVSFRFVPANSTQQPFAAGANVPTRPLETIQ